MIEFFLFIFLFLTLILSYLFNKDIFSPTKFYLFYLYIYFFSIYIIEQNEYVYAIYFMYIIFGLLIMIVEYNITRKYTNTSFVKSFYLLNENKILLILWIMTIPSIISQVYLFYYFGSISGYFLALELRVEMWKGLGPIIFLIKIVPIVNIIYFLIGLIFKIKHTKIWWFTFSFHSFLVIILGLLSGSRSNTLTIFIFLLILYNYLHSKVSLKKVFIISVSLILVAVILGNIRNQVSYSSDSLEDVTFLDEKKEFKFAIGDYGLTQLNGIFDKDFTDYQYGMTFLTTFTNFIPRVLWENKPDSGGIIITKHIKGSDYNPYSHYSTGLLTESIINFGYYLGFVVFLMLMSIFTYYNLYVYKKILINTYNSLSPIKTLKLAYLNILFVMLSGKLLYSEFTNIMFDLIFKYIIFTFLILIIVNILKYEKIKDKEKLT